MEIISKSRGGGKTQALILISEIMKIPIVVCTEEEKKYVLKLSKQLECVIPSPLTVRQLHVMKTLDGRLDKRVLLDDMDLVIQEALNDYLNADVVMCTTSIGADTKRR